MAENEKQEKKLIIDEDWKNQAEHEKELDEQKVEEEHKREARSQMPPADLFGLISMLATQALFALGLISEEKNKKPPVNLPLAQYSLELLGVIEEKTKGNLTHDEEEMLKNTLYQLRMAFVQVAGPGTV
jgi:hypothetical protein